MQRQRNEESGAGTRPRLDGDAAVVGDDHLLDECEAETRPVRLRREEGPEDAGRIGLVHARAIVGNGDALLALRRVDCAVDGDVRRDACRAAGLERVAAQVAQRLSQQDFVAFDRSEFAVDETVAGSRQGVCPDFVRGPFGRSRMSTRRAPAAWAWRSSGSW